MSERERQRIAYGIRGKREGGREESVSNKHYFSSNICTEYVGHFAHSTREWGMERSSNHLSKMFDRHVGSVAFDFEVQHIIG